MIMILYSLRYNEKNQFVTELSSIVKYKMKQIYFHDNRTSLWYILIIL